VLLPQAFQLELPATINLATRVIKTTSLLMMISVMDLINVGQQIIEANNQSHPTAVFWIYGLIFLLYFIVDYPLSLWSKKVARRKQD
jgi:polar amino acid transport system permease protein